MILCVSRLSWLAGCLYPVNAGYNVSIAYSLHLSKCLCTMAGSNHVCARFTREQTNNARGGGDAEECRPGSQDLTHRFRTTAKTGGSDSWWKLIGCRQNYPSLGLKNFMSLRQQWHDSILYLGYKLWVWTFLAVTTHISIMHLLIIFSLAFYSFNYIIMFTFDVHIPWMNHGAQICQGLTSWHPNDLACLNTQFVCYSWPFCLVLLSNGF